jgi:hypothetical protein
MEAGGRVEVDLQFGHGDFAVESGEAVSSWIISVPSNITTVTARPSKRLLSPLPLAEANR